MKTHSRFLPVVAFALAAAAALSTRAATPSYKFLEEIPVGGDGGGDLLTVDPFARRLYVTHSSKIVVINLDTDKVVGEITNTPGVHDFAIDAMLRRGFSSNGGENKVSVVDLKTLQTLTTVDTGQGPDTIIDGGRDEIYAFNAQGKSATVFDAKTGNVLATIPLPGKPEFAVANPRARRVYCNIQDKNEVAVIDTKTHTVIANWSTAPGEGPTGMGFDIGYRRLFIGCRNKMMVILDAMRGNRITTEPIGEGVDACQFDRDAQLAFASCGDGTVTIVHEIDGDRYAHVQTLKTEPGARTMALDPKTHRIYLATAKFETPTEKPEPGKRQRPKVVAGTFKVLVYGMDKEGQSN